MSLRARNVIKASSIELHITSKRKPSPSLLYFILSWVGCVLLQLDHRWVNCVVYVMDHRCVNTCQRAELWPSGLPSGSSFFEMQRERTIHAIPPAALSRSIRDQDLLMLIEVQYMQPAQTLSMLLHLLSNKCVEVHFTQVGAHKTEVGTL